MSVSLTDIEKIRRLPWLVAADTINTGFFLLTFAGSVFILFLNELGMDKGQIGFLLSLVPFCGIIAPFIAPQIARFGYKRVYVTFWAVRSFVFALILFTPMIVARYGLVIAFYWVATIIVGFAICRAIAETGGYPWRKEAVPDSIRGKFSAINSMSTTVAAIIVTTGAALVIDAGTGLGRFMLLISVGIALGLASVWCYAQVPGGAPIKNPTATHSSGLKSALLDRNFRRFLWVLGLATIGGTSVISFVPLYMTEQVGLSEGNVVLLSIGTYIGALLTSYWWGWLADRYGSQPVMQFSLYFMILLPIAWFLMPKHSPLSLPVALTIALLAGVATLAWQISWLRYLYVNAVPPRRETPYLAIYYAWFGITSGLGPLLAGQLIVGSRSLTVTVASVSLDPYTPLFGLSVILLTMSVFTVTQLTSTEATTFRRLAGMFLRGNPIRALNSLVQYNFSGSEMTRVTTTERMGDAQNLLSSQELIEALNDPSFNVRYEAIHSIGRLPPEPKLVEALVAILREGQSELSFVVIQALGRLGDRQAIPLLRELLDSDYHLLAAHSARALARLGDTACIPRLLAKFKSESNGILRIAYASALGSLGCTEALAELFELLRQTPGEAQRGEIGLALARIAGDEHYYMQHWRSLRAKPNTATAQALLALQKKAKHLKLDSLANLAEQSANYYAQGDPHRGTALLCELIDQLSPETLDKTLVYILTECVRNIAEFGHARPEFVLLTLHALNLALHQLDTSMPNLTDDHHRLKPVISDQ